MSDGLQEEQRLPRRAVPHAYEPVKEARTLIGKYLEFYNSIRPHSSLKALTPDQVYFNLLPESVAV
jgi:putative transposase